MSSSEVVLIAAVARNGVIGADGGLPWHLPQDLKRFKALTIGHPVVMGRRTFESITGPLPGRTNVVVTSDLAYDAPGCLVVHSLSEALTTAAASPGGAVIFVIGGGVLYEDAIEVADRIELTAVDLTVPGDTWFPALHEEDWEVASVDPHPPEGTRPGFEYRTLRRTLRSR